MIEYAHGIFLLLQFHNHQTARRFGKFKAFLGGPLTSI